jgi:hypothetical protein
MMDSFFIDFNSVAVFIVFDWIVVGVVLNEIPVMVVGFRHPFCLCIPINITFFRLIYVFDVFIFILDRFDIGQRAQLFKTMIFIMLLMLPRFEEGGL